MYLLYILYIYICIYLLYTLYIYIYIYIKQKTLILIKKINNILIQNFKKKNV